MTGALRHSVFLCLVGPAGGGKTTLGDLLLGSSGPGISRLVTATSRPPRPGETDGKSYHFLGEEGFRRGIERSEFFEWEKTHGNLYGTPRSVLDASVAAGDDLLLVVDVRGARTFKDCYPKESVVVFLVPPSKGDLAARLRGRGVCDAELDVRIRTAEREYSVLATDPGLVDYLVVNDELDRAHAELRSILTAERLRYTRAVRPGGAGERFGP